MREAIFVVEQACIYHELDGLDKLAKHLLVMQEQAVIAWLRVLPPDVVGDLVRIVRVAVSPGWREQGIARLMVQMAQEKIQDDYPSSVIFLDAQTYLREFYLSLGFQVCGDAFLEDGIPHIPMQM